MINFQTSNKDATGRDGAGRKVRGARGTEMDTNRATSVGGRRVSVL